MYEYLGFSSIGAQGFVISFFLLLWLRPPEALVKKVLCMLPGRLSDSTSVSKSGVRLFEIRSSRITALEMRRKT